jgi:hypothetical protein
VICQLSSLVNVRALYNNNITGTIPEELGNLASLESLDLYLNNLSGTIPDTLGKLQKLRFLYGILSLFSYLLICRIYLSVSIFFFIYLVHHPQFFVFSDAKYGRFCRLYNMTITFSANCSIQKCMPKN